MKAEGSDLSRMDLRRLARSGQPRQGQLPGSTLTRLAQDTVGSPGDVRWSARGESRAVAASAPELWLHLRCESAVELICQRCLQPVVESIRVERSIRFVGDEVLAESLDEHSDDDVLAMPEAGLDLITLIEDELILALPLVPRHVDCPQPLPMVADTPMGAEPATNPFQVLAALKRRES